jgi:hypothetical protein
MIIFFKCNLKLVEKLISLVLVRQGGQSYISESSIRLLEFLVFLLDDVFHLIYGLARLGRVNRLVIVYDAEHLAAGRSRSGWILARAVLAKSSSE